MMLTSKKRKKGTESALFKRDAYIPKSKLNKKGRTVPQRVGKKRGAEGEPKQGSIFRFFLVSILWLLFLGELAFVIFFANFFTLTNIVIQQEETEGHISGDSIRSFVEASVAGTWYQVIPKNNLLLLSTKNQEQQIQQRFPKFATVTVAKQFPHTLAINVTEKPFQILWCTKEDCFLVDPEGRAQSAEVFFQYPEEQGIAVRIQDKGEGPVHIGQLVMEKTEQKFVEAFTKDFTLRTELLVEGPLERPSLYAKELRVHTDKGFTLFLNTELSVAESLNNLMLILEKEIPEGEWSQIDYIDLRSENRIYYTRKDQAPAKTEAQIQREEEAKKKREEEAQNKDTQ